MSEIDFLQLLSYALPALVVGVVSFYFFNSHLQNEERRRAFHIRKTNSKETLPLRLQAYERLALYLERISLQQLLVRVSPQEMDKTLYVESLITIMEQEFEHNTAQQIYVSSACWDALRTSKNTTIIRLRKMIEREEIESGLQLREAIFKDLLQRESPSETGLAFLKNEVRQLW